MHALAVPIAVISAWLGHADPAFTMRAYVHTQERRAEGGRGRLAEGCDKLVTPRRLRTPVRWRARGVCAA